MKDEVSILVYLYTGVGKIYMGGCSSQEYVVLSFVLDFDRPGRIVF